MKIHDNDIIIRQVRTYDYIESVRIIEYNRIDELCLDYRGLI